MDGNFKFQAQDIFFEQFFWEIRAFEKRISLSEKKAPLAIINQKKKQLFAKRTFLFGLEKKFRQIEAGVF